MIWDRVAQWREAEEKGRRICDEQKVLVLGDDTRSFLATVRSLGRQGIKVHAAPANFRSPALRSRYISAIHDLPPWMGEGTEWLNAITTLLRNEGYRLVIPCNETMLLPLQRHREKLSQYSQLAIPDDRAIAVLFDKHEMRELARPLGVPIAPGRLCRLDDTAESVLTELGAPVVVKPRRSYSLEQLATRGQVRIVSAPDRLDRLLSECDPSETLVEQLFAGQGVGVSLLASRGRILQAFEHHRIREVDGASFYRRSAPLTPDLERACEAIIAALDYTGLAMFEFKVNPGGQWILLEVNARPWGSMPLPLALGVDFPYRWYRLLTAGEEMPAVPYRTGVNGRNLVPDLGNSLIEAEARQLGPTAKAWFMLGRLAELTRFLIDREVHDVLVGDDLRPGIIEMLELVRAVGRRAGRLRPLAASRRRRRARAQVKAVPKAPGRPGIIFVCQGNICRSPFAAALLRERLGEAAVSIYSAGMMPRPGRPTPIFGIEAAAAFGVDLSAHRSTWLTRQMAEDACLLIAFDDISRSAVLDRYPDLRVPMICLGDLAEVGEIRDPIDGGTTEFSRTYDQIAIAVTELAQLLLRRTHLATALPDGPPYTARNRLRVCAAYKHNLTGKRRTN